MARADVSVRYQTVSLLPRSPSVPMALVLGGNPV